MTGNCLGWCAYAYYTNDAFVLFANLPGLTLSFWLNMGASKLQYAWMQQLKSNGGRSLRGIEESVTESPEIVVSRDDINDDSLDDPLIEDADIEMQVLCPQETALFRILIFWALTLVWVGWIHPANPTYVLGIVVNMNLVFFYGAPLQAMKTVIKENQSDSIHMPTLIMHIFNTAFWMAYGVARRDPVILLPNAVGLFLGVIQGVLRLLYPKSPPDGTFEPLQQQLPESRTQIS